MLTVDLRAGFFYRVILKTSGTQWAQLWSQCGGRTELGSSTPHANTQYSTKTPSSKYVYEMVHNIRKYLVFGLEIGTHNVLETGSATVLREEGDTYSVGSFRKS